MLNDKSLKECIAQARAKIRKNSRIISPSKRQKAFVTASTAGLCWEHEDSACSYGMAYSPPYNHLSEQHKQHYLKHLPKWRDLSDLEKVFLTHEYICTNPDLIPVSFTFNTGDLSEITIRENSNLNYPRDQTTKAFKMVLGNQKILFWMVEETRKRIHFHGVIGVPKSIATPEIMKALAKALSSTPMVKKRKEIGRNKAAYVSTTYKTTNNSEVPVNSGAVLYATKEWTNSRKPRFSISSPLRKLTGERYDQTIKLLKQ